MAYSNKSRTLRDGSLVISDGTSGTPVTCTIPCDDGDLSWSMKQNIQKVFCRGIFDHVRKGEDQGLELKFSCHWTNLIQKSETSGDPASPYEMIMNVGDTFNSTVAVDVHCLDYIFTVVDPADTAGADETITFTDVYRTDLTCEEGEVNKISFTGESLDEEPTIARV